MKEVVKGLTQKGIEAWNDRADEVIKCGPLVSEERAAEILGQTKNVIKKMVRAREIPYYDKGRKVYFFEDELVKWVEESRVKTWSEEYKKNKRLY